MLTIDGRPPFPLFIDSTARSQFVECPHKFFLSTLNNLTPSQPSIHLHAGGAFAKGLEAARKAFFVDGKSQSDAETEGARALILAYGDFPTGDSDAKTAERMLGALDYYFSIWPLAEDPIRPHLIEGARAIEFSFSVPTNITHPETGDPILYCGRFDQVVEFNGTLLAEDDKTTSQLGASWSNQWPLRGQLIGYSWAAQAYGLPVVGSLIRGVAIRKTGYDHAQAIISHPQWLIDRWYAQMERDLLRMIECWRAEVWDQAFGEPCTTYGGCQFRRLCESANPEGWLEPYFAKRNWNPVWSAANGA